MEIRTETQLHPVADEVSAITAVVRPILVGTLYGLKREVAEQLGGYANVKLSLLGRIRRQGDGDCGICYEYAVHDALIRHEPVITERVTDALTGQCNVRGSSPASILFGAEKTGSQQLIDTAKELLTDDSSLLSGARGRPVKLRRHIDAIAAAFRRPNARLALPQSIGGVWKADLFLGYSDTDRWVGTSVKINAQHLEGARGLRIGIVPSREGASDLIYLDNQRNLVVCPLPHDGSFMEVFYKAWGVVQQFLAADSQLPSEVSLPRPAERQVARYLADRRDFSVLQVVDALVPLAQPELLETSERAASVVLTRESQIEVGAVIAPLPTRV
jgi:hypothetical protein